MLLPWHFYSFVATSGLQMTIATAWAVAAPECMYYPCSLWWLQSNRATSLKMPPKVFISPSIYSSIHPSIYPYIHASIHPFLHPTFYTAALYLINPCKARLLLLYASFPAIHWLIRWTFSNFLHHVLLLLQSISVSPPLYSLKLNQSVATHNELHTVELLWRIRT